MKILAISWASHTAVNRQIFRALHDEPGLEVKLIFPQKITKNGVSIDCDPYTDETLKCSSLDISSFNPRYNRYIGVFHEIKKFDPDIIFHEDDPISFQAIQYGLWCYLNQRKLVCRTNQNLKITYASEIKRLGIVKGLFYTTLKLLIFRISRLFISHIFAVSSDGVSVFRELGFKSISKIPIGLDEQIFKRDLVVRQRLRSQLNLEGVVFAYIGRVMEGKGVHILLDALSGMLEYNWKILIDSFERPAATDYERKILKMLQSTRLKERVLFFEADHIEVASYMNAADVVIVPSITTKNFKEQYGRVGPEAMACGCLVIASDCGTLPELVRPMGWVFEEGNVPMLRELLLKALNSPTAKVPCKEIERYAHHKLGISAQKKQILEVLSVLQ